jgi:catechol 2,3-dioxygenase-like lactoylglutathione lyase family enzyme
MLARGARYRHTNLVAHDWARLATFYERVFGCERVPPERDQRGDWLSRGTGVDDAHLRGVHLRLPGGGPGAPTLEIYQYERVVSQGEPVANRAGFGHIAFAVDDVEQALSAVVDAGGARLGEVVTTEVAGAGTLCFTYARDPEGNLIELQRWGATPERA